ncbi:MAG: virulence RhuM family protein [Crocinitomicaceae bacterium]|nr:virulence RhuM family protein [Crocinitomicaceae bacterium]
MKLDVTLVDETVWLTQAQLCELFQKSKATISEHIKNIFEEGELNEEVVGRNFRSTTQHVAIADKTQQKEVKHYNLDVIISVGYRVKSAQGTQFRIWATQRLKEYIIKGFTLNDERFKSGNTMNYFTELQERFVENLNSFRFFYQKTWDMNHTRFSIEDSFIFCTFGLCRIKIEMK